MKPVDIAVLILAGALAGAGLMRVVQRPKFGVRTGTVARVQALPAMRPIAQPAASQAAAAQAAVMQAAVEAPAKPPSSPVAEAAAPRHPEPDASAAEAPKPKPSPLGPRSAPVARRQAPAPPRHFYNVDVPAPSGIPPGFSSVEVTPIDPPGNPPADSPANVVPGLTASAAPGPMIPPPLVNAEPENATPANTRFSAAPAPQPRHVTLNAGLLLTVRVVDRLSSERNVPGDVFDCTLDRELVIDDLIIADRGARVEGRVIAADRGGKVHGVAALALELTRLHTSDGQVVPIQTFSFFRHAEVAQDQYMEKLLGGTLLGAVIGGLAGGGKGLAIGAGAGAGVGTGAIVLTPPRPAVLLPETRLTFRMRNPVALTERLQAP